jgi:hypothetical protein
MYRLDLTPVNGLGRITWGWAARRGACGTAWASVDIGQVCRGHASRRRGPGQPVTVLHSPNAPLWRTVCARGGAKGKAEGPGGLNSAGGGPRAGRGARRRPPARGGGARIRRSRPYLFICKYITCAMIHVHSWSRGRVLQCEDPTETPRGRTDAHGPHASTRARRDAPVRTR